MTATHKNRLVTTVSAVASAGLGAFTVDAASSGYRTFGAGDDGLTFDGITITEGTAWERRDGCVYTHSGTSLSRGTLMDSSVAGPTAVAFTAAAVITQGGSAELAAMLQLAMASTAPGGRLTLESGVPVSTTDQTAKTSIYYAPYAHNVIPLWDGYKWAPIEFTEKTLALGTLISLRPYDVFGYLSIGALVLESLGWATSTFTVTIASPGVVSWTAHGHANGDGVVFATSGALPTGLTAGVVYYVVNKTTDTFQVAATRAGAAINTSGSQSGTHTAYSQCVRGTAVTLQDGRYAKSGDKTRLYLGTFRTTSTTTTEDSGYASTTAARKRFLWNAYNRVKRVLQIEEDTASWTWSTSATWRQWRAQADNQAEAVVGLPGLSSISLTCNGTGARDSIGGSASVSIGYDSAIAMSDYTVSSYTASYSGSASTPLFLSSTLSMQPDIGYHYWPMLEAWSGTGSAGTYYGTSAAARRSGMVGWVEA